MKPWDNILDLKGYVIENKGEYGYIGRLVDENNNTINILGMPQDNIAYSHSKEATENIVKKNFAEAMEIVNRNKNK